MNKNKKKNRNKVPNYNQELSLKIKLEEYGRVKGAYYFGVGSKYYYENNIDVEYYLLYHNNIYRLGNFFYMDENQANQLFLDIEKSIIDSIKSLNPIIKEKIQNYKSLRKTREPELDYKIIMSFDDSENIFPKLNPEEIFKPIISILKDRNVEITNLSEYIKRITISLKDKNLQIEIEKSLGELYTDITYNNKIDDKSIYEITLKTKIGETNNMVIREIETHMPYDLFKEYNHYLEFIESLKPDKFLDLIINPIIQYENDIRKAINEYEFYDALKSMDVLVNRNYNEDEIKNLWYNISNSKLKSIIYNITKYHIEC